MTKPLTTEELNNINPYAQSLGFEGTILNSYTVFKKKFNELSIVKVYYDLIKDNAYVEINCGSVSIQTNEVDKFIEVLNQARMIAKKLEGDENK